MKANETDTHPRPPQAPPGPPRPPASPWVLRLSTPFGTSPGSGRRPPLSHRCQRLSAAAAKSALRSSQALKAKQGQCQKRGLVRCTLRSVTRDSSEMEPAVPRQSLPMAYAKMEIPSIPHLKDTKCPKWSTQRGGRPLPEAADIAGVQSLAGPGEDLHLPHPAEGFVWVQVFGICLVYTQ